MKIGEMLSELKKEEAGLKRLISIRKETFWVENRQKSVISTNNLTEQIRKKTDLIRKKKLAVQQNNLKIKIGEFSLSEAILKISDLREEISQLNELKNGDHFRGFRDEKESKTPQLNPLQLEEIIAELESEKAKLDSQIQSVNWKEEIQ